MFSVTLSNENCKIKIVCAQEDGVTLGSVTSLKIKRREQGDTFWTLINTRTITTLDDFDFTFYDKYTRSRRTYEYQFIMLEGETELEPEEYNIECNFDKIYISDSSAEYFLDLNTDYDFDGNEEVSYPKPINSKYPFRVQNGLSDYATGFVEALPLALDSKGYPTLTGSQKYKELFVSWLKNGNTKYLKTYKGEAWLVSIDANPKTSQSDIEGMEKVKFNWTEYDDAPLSDL